jgi:hypothetical protein
MTNLQVFLECVIDAPHWVYGYRLRPLSLFHLAMLEEYAPSAMGGLCTERDLQIAACICASRNAQDFRRKSKGLRAWIAGFYGYPKQVQKFGDYLADYLTLPETSKSKDIQNNPFPSSLLFAAKLIKETGYAFDQVFYDMSVSQIFWLAMALGYIESGETTVVSDKEREIYRVIEAAKVTG